MDGPISGPTGRLYVDEGGPPGDGLPVLFVHSAAGDASQWAAQLAHVRTRRRAIALDLRGHGRSDPPRDGDYSLAGFSADIGAVADRAGLDRFILVGHSLGANVALEYAAQQPERVAALLLVDGGNVTPESTLDADLAYVERLRGQEYPSLMTTHWTEITRGGDPRTAARVLETMRATPRATVIEALHHLVVHDPAAALDRYPGPAMLVLSPITDDETALHHHVEDLPHVLIDRAGHWLHMDRPEQFNRVLDEFLSSLEDRPFTGGG